MTVQFLFGPEDGLMAEVSDDCYQLRFPMTTGTLALMAWTCEGDHGGNYVYERDTGSDKFVYSGVS